LSARAAVDAAHAVTASVAKSVREILFINVSNIGTQGSDRPAPPEVPAKLPRCGTRYTPAMRIAHLWILVSLTALLAGCGQKGPLVLPDAPKHKKAVPVTPAGAPAPPATATAPDADRGSPDSATKP